jgi:tRNA modification GTPase
VVEKIGVERAKNISKDADLILYVVDSSVELDDSDREIIQMIQDKKVIILLNKSDLEEVVDEKSLYEEIRNVYDDSSKNSDNTNIDIENKKDSKVFTRIIKTSTKDETGIDTLTNLIQDMFFHGKLSYNDEVYITNMRHKEAIADAKESMLQVVKSLDMDMPEDFYSIDLMSAYASLGTIIGEEVGEDLVNEIFSKFCMGK